MYEETHLQIYQTETTQKTSDYIYLCFLFNVWKIGFNGRIELDSKGTSGCFICPLTEFLETDGEVAFSFCCFGASNLSRILVVFSSKGLVWAVKLEFWDLGLEMQVDE